MELALSVTGANPLQTLRLLEAFSKVKGEAWFSSLVTAAVRVKNILAKAENAAAGVNEGLFVKEPEKNLYAAVAEADAPVAEAMAQRDWNGLMSVLAKLSPAVAAFFDDVMVMDEDRAVRANRLSLLSKCQELFMRVGDLSKAK